MLNASLSEIEHLAGSHYENFPVAPWFLPKALREPIAIIYAFARSADDLADEGDFTPEQRQASLGTYKQHLDTIAKRENLPTDLTVLPPLFQQVAKIIDQHRLPIQYFYDLISAFVQDTHQVAYEDEQALMDYCRRSANPVGRLLLHLYFQKTPEDALLKQSDNICTALQRINFCQDLGQDLKQRNRLYIPLEALKQFGVTTNCLYEGKLTPNVSRLVQHQWQRSCDLLIDGSKLTQSLRGRFGFGILLTIGGGAAMLRALSARTNPYERITLNKWHCCQLLLFCLLNKPTHGLRYSTS